MPDMDEIGRLEMIMDLNKIDYLIEINWAEQ